MKKAQIVNLIFYHFISVDRKALYDFLINTIAHCTIFFRLPAVHILHDTLSLMLNQWAELMALQLEYCIVHSFLCYNRQDCNHINEPFPLFDVNSFDLIYKSKPKFELKITTTTTTK